MPVLWQEIPLLSGTLLGSIKEWIIASDDMNNFKNHVEQKKLDTEEYIFFMIASINFLE